MLSNPTATVKISAIADDVCFSDASNFSRAYKREFGCRHGGVCNSCQHSRPNGA
jgi:AraC-like DNA-binding protein